MRKIAQKAQDLSLPLIAGVALALIWANLDPSSYEGFVHFSPFGEHGPLSVHFVVNDLFMVFFFGIAAKEITEAVLPGGALNPPRKAANPLIATLGGVVGPALVYLGYVHFVGQTELMAGWAIPTATDIALAWLVARLAFGPKHPAVSFLLLLAVADDAIGLVIIGAFYPDPAHPIEPAWLLLVVAGMVLAYAMRRRKVRSFVPYLAVSGVLSWVGLSLAHVHPALALVPIVPFMPNAGHDEGLFAELDHGDRLHDTLNRFEHTVRTPVDFGLFAFGLANAGVVASDVGHASWAVLMALVVGKTLGIFSASISAHYAGFPLPHGMNARSLLVAGLTASLGLTVALFVAGVAFTDPALVGAAKMGALLSAGAAPVVMFLARVLRVRGTEPMPEPRREPALVPSIPPHA
ncbi:MAG: Na+/H+ antiporter NhaA [Myxococcales bacterium]|nr:Na+/H+ antiporter NhaA [Myxococcales bacterium]